MALLKIMPYIRHRMNFSNPIIICCSKRLKSDNSKIIVTGKKSELDTNVKPIEKVKEATKTVSYMGVILVGIGITGALFYGVFSELFSSKSPNSVYSKALKRCIADSRVEDCLGYPIKGFGEETRRGRRRHVNHMIFEKDGRKHMRMSFHLQGCRKKGTVNLEVVENSSGVYEYRYLFVQVEDYANTVIILEDNRHLSSEVVSKPSTFRF